MTLLFPYDFISRYWCSCGNIKMFPKVRYIQVTKQSVWKATDSASASLTTSGSTLYKSQDPTLLPHDAYPMLQVHLMYVLLEHSILVLFSCITNLRCSNIITISLSLCINLCIDVKGKVSTIGACSIKAFFGKNSRFCIFSEVCALFQLFVWTFVQPTKFTSDMSVFITFQVWGFNCTATS